MVTHGANNNHHSRISNTNNNKEVDDDAMMGPPKFGVAQIIVHTHVICGEEELVGERLSERATDTDQSDGGGAGMRQQNIK